MWGKYGGYGFIIGYITGKVVLDIIPRFYTVDNPGTDSEFGGCGRFVERFRP